MPDLQPLTEYDAAFDVLAAHLPDEVVTGVTVRDVELPGDAGILALITLQGGRESRPATLGPRGLRALAGTLDAVRLRAAAGELAGVGVIGRGRTFVAGADLRMVGTGTDPELALLIGRLGHAVFRRLGELGVPTFAYLNGTALGGGLELALHCAHRTVAEGVGALGLPECHLGLVPAWGGCTLLPRLIGPGPALEVIVGNPLHGNRFLDARAAHRLGIADALLPADRFEERSLGWTAEVLTSPAPASGGPAGPDGSRDADRQAGWESAVAAMQARVEARLHGAAPAPYRALDLVRLARTADLDTGFAAEDQALAELAATPQLRAGLYAFDLVTRRARRPAGLPDGGPPVRPVSRAGVVGAGLMGRQLALLLLRRLGVPVVITDLDAARVDDALRAVRGELAGLAGKGRLAAGEADRLAGLLSGSTDPGAQARADAVIEAVVEVTEVKRRVFARLEEVTGPECLLLSNTSALPVGDLADGLQHPERVAGLHFFTPVAAMPLVEVVRARHTGDAAVAGAAALGQALGKTCVLVRDAPGFVVNRLLVRLLEEVLAAIGAGADPVAADRAMDPLGLPVRPLSLLRLVGPPVALHVSRTLHAAYPDRFGVPTLLQGLVDAGVPGMWTTAGDGESELDPAVAALLAGRPTGGSMQAGAWDEAGAELRGRALRALAEEIAIMLVEGVVTAREDIDLCMILGAGWPFHLGGITPYLDRSGAR